MPTNKASFSVVALLLLVVCLPLAGNEPKSIWGQFRGPDANPVADGFGLPAVWSSTQSIEWETAIPGRGWSSPIVTGKRVLVTSVVTDGESKPPQVGVDYSNEYVAELTKQGLAEDEVMKRVMERDFELPDEVNLHYNLHCLDLETGREIWKSEFYTGKPPGGRHRKNSFVSETPATDGEAIYVFASNLGLWCFDLDGQQRWHTPVKNYPIYLEFGTGSSPVVVGDYVVTLNDNEEHSYIAAYSKQDGGLAWEVDRQAPDELAAGLPKSGWTTPLVWQNSLRTELVTVGPGMARSYDLAGNELWRMSDMTPAPAASSFAYEDVLLLNGGKGKAIHAIRPGAEGDISLKPGEESNEFIIWSCKRAGTYIPTPVAYRGALYVVQDNGVLIHVDLKTGKEIYKNRISKQGADFSASPWAYDGKLFCLSEQGDTYVIAAGTQFELLGTNSLGEFSMSSPAMAMDRLLIRTDAALRSIRKMQK